MGNGFVHIELNTDDVAKAKKFYKALFDWKVADMPGMNYAMVDAGKGKTGGGMQKHPMPGSPNGWLAYVEVADIKKTLAKAEKAGGSVIHPYTEIGEGMGAIAILQDPSHAMLGLWQMAPPKKKAAKKAAKKPAKKAAKKR